MNPAIWSAIVTTLGLIVIALIADRQSKRGARATNALAERVVDREDFDAVMTRMERDLERSDKRITDLETRLEAEVTAREKAEERAERAEKRAAALERRVTQLEEVLRQHDIPVPPQPSTG